MTCSTLFHRREKAHESNRPDPARRRSGDCDIRHRAGALNIRKWPSAQSQIIDAYQLNEPISLTGRCKNIVTNVSFRIDGLGSPERKYGMMKRANVWCQVMTNDAETGWARGKYIWPE